ncbi:MAG: transglycosylase SLT domain-containing protein [Paracoccaceae bacterium]
MRFFCLPALCLLAFAQTATAQSPRPAARPAAPPAVETAARAAAQWDHLPQAALWSRAAVAALFDHGTPLLRSTPADIAKWCPGYLGADAQGRAAFWTSLLSALARYESTFDPAAVGSGKWYGLLQIAPATARGYGCRAKTGAGLKDAAANLSCAVRIWSVTVPRDGVLAEKGGRLAGIAADWGPMRFSDKRARMAAYTRAQPYCSLRRSVRPGVRVAR